MLTTLEQHQVHTNEQVEDVVKLYLSNADRELIDSLPLCRRHALYLSNADRELIDHLCKMQWLFLYLSNADRELIDPILDACVEVYKELDENSQVSFKGTAKAFVRTYSFLAAIMPFCSHEWEKLSIFWGLLVRKLPSPKGEYLISGLLESVDYSSYRNIIQIEQKISLENDNSEINPIPVGGSGGAIQPEVEQLSNILDEFNSKFGNINWTDSDRVRKQIAAIPEELKKNEAYQNTIKNSDRQTARIESDKALMAIILKSMSSGVELYKEYQDNSAFQRWLQEAVFEKTYANDYK